MTAGLNGDRVFTAMDVPVGRVSGEAYGYARDLTVTIDVRMERLTRQTEYETTDHRKVRRPLDFAITTAVWRPDKRDIVSGGATVDPLRELTTYTNGFSDRVIAELLSMAEYHLNGMTAGCDHQTAVWEDGRYGRQISLTDTLPCPVTGYRYGSAWLVRELPYGFLSRVRAVFANATDQTRMYDAHADAES